MNKPFKPDHAFILAAGEGTRMRPLTNTIPKPMVELAGKPLIRHIIEKLDAEGVTDIGVNTHHLYDVIETYMAAITRPRIHVSRETTLLNTGGGVKKALSNLGTQPFYHINGDAFWTDGYVPALTRLAQAWDASKMDILMLLIPVEKMILTQGVGDYDLDTQGRAMRSVDQRGQFMFTGIRITSPYIFSDTIDENFSFLSLMDKSEKKGRLYGIVHDGDWHHISTPEDLSRVNAHLARVQSN